MKLSELMKDITVNPSFEGGLVHNDMVLAIDTTPNASSPTDVADYAVVQIQIEGTEASLNPETSSKTYIRSGTASAKTGNQRTFKVSGERYIGDAAQDFMLSHKVKFGIGADCATNYVYFDMRTGKGEKGTVMVSVNTDGGGDASGGLEIDIDLMQNGLAPVEYNYTA